jgi:twitching motility protein PilT
MVSLNDALMDLVNKKLVEPAEALAKAVDKNGFDSLLKRAGHNVAGVADVKPRAQTTA